MAFFRVRFLKTVWYTTATTAVIFVLVTFLSQNVGRVPERRSTKLDVIKQDSVKRFLDDQIRHVTNVNRGQDNEDTKYLQNMGGLFPENSTSVPIIAAPTITTKVTVHARARPEAEVRHVAFLKVHKAASSTGQNIFLRFGWNRNLSFVLSPAKNPFGYPNIISTIEALTDKNILPPPAGKHYEVLCNHVFYKKESWDRFMPNDTVYIGIVREPFEQYKSTLNYFHPLYIFRNKVAHASSLYLRDPLKYEPKKVIRSWTNNRMSLEFGFPEHLFLKFNEEDTISYLQQLDKDFGIILIAECLEESVVMMRRYLHWQVKDVLYIDKNVARHKNETMLSQAYDREFYKRWAKLDYALYEFFYKRLRAQIRDEGADFDEELIYFKDLRKMTQEFCRLPKSSVLKVDKSKWSESFNITTGDCENLRRQEIDFVQRIRLRQYGSKTI